MNRRSQLAPVRPQPVPYISLFSGGMGLDLGLESAGFTPIACNEIDPAAVKTIRVNRPDLPVITESVARVSERHFSEVLQRCPTALPLLVGGPPCQAFSVYGKRQGTIDGRGQLLYEFVRLVGELRPHVFLMENVRGLHSMPRVPIAALRGKVDVPRGWTEHGSLLRELFRRFESIGYRVDCFIVNAVNYGAPQLRERLLCIGNRFNLTATFPQPEYSNRPEDQLPPFRTLGEAIGTGFRDPDPQCMNFSPRKLRYLAMVPAGGNWRSLPEAVQKESMGKAWYLKGGRSAYWRKLSWEFPSPTVVTMPNHAGTSMCHPVELRALTVGECAAVQEFPTDWQFQGTAAEKYRQIGNAVPVRLGRIAGQVVASLLQSVATSGSDVSTPMTPSRVVHIRPHVRTRTFWKDGEAFAGDCSYYDDEDEPEDRLRQPSLF